MRRIVNILVLAGFALGVPARAEEGPTTFYVQLIWGTDGEHPPEPGSKRAGPKVSDVFRPVFKWKNYWEICRKQVPVALGHKARVRLSHEREVEIDLTNPKLRKVTAFHKSEFVDRTIKSAGEGMTLIGGDRDRQSVWFIVVRRDKPAE